MELISTKPVAQMNIHKQKKGHWQEPELQNEGQIS
jgi:hypothetical protein